MLPPRKVEEYGARGVVRVDGLLSEAGVRAAREALLFPLAQLGFWRDGAWRLDADRRPQWPSAGLNATKLGRFPELDVLIEEPALIESIAALDACAVAETARGHPQLLITLPNARTWFVPPNVWHLDFPRLASGQSPGVQLFAFLDTVEPRGGGTLVVAGSHRLLNTGRFIRSRDVKRQMGREEFFRVLFSPKEDRTGILGKTGAVGDVPVEVVELTGEPGDAYLMDLRVLHTLAPNASKRPRIMITYRFVRAECTAEQLNPSRL
jgi:ectoine hydroxylase-related dioxygenase (phytanoyl-CoA dioxygenase family)